MKKYERAEITTDFVNAVIEIAKARIAHFASEMKYASPRRVAMLREKYGPTVAKLSRLRTEDGRDFEITRFRGLEYSKYEVIEYKGKRYLAAHTKDVEMVEYRTEKASRTAPRWNMGPYTVYLSVEDLKNGSIHNPQFIPDADPLTYYRHPHHKGAYYQAGAQHPLDINPSTCWGSYGAIVSDCAVNGDIVELFRSIHSYLTRYNPRSPLGAGVEGCGFAKEVYHARAV